jgi:DNA-binding Xre family transcriptional regulator
MELIMPSGIVNLRVGAILKQRGISAEEFSRKSGLNYRTALSIAKNRYERIGLDTIGKICDTLQVTPGEIFEYNPTVSQLKDD